MLLDYDGTLSPFTPDRDNAYPYDGVVERLTHLSKLNRTRFALISGREIASLSQLIQLDKYPEIWGSHGAEHLTTDSKYSLQIGQQTKNGLKKASDWAKLVGLDSVTEIKPAGCAFHWRGLPDGEIGVIKEKVTSFWETRVDSFGLELHYFNGGIEIRPAHLTKGTAVEAIIQNLKDNTPIAYLGDDQTDEDAFCVLGERGLKVLVQSEPRPTLADILIKPPEELLEFLDRWIAATT